MEKFYNLIKSKSSRKNLVTGLLIILLVNLVLFPNVPKWMGVDDFSTDHVLDLKFGYTVDEAHFALESMGLEGRKAYLVIEIAVDFLYAIVYGFFYAALLILFFEKSRSKLLKNVFIIPIIGGTLDILENVAIIPLIINFPTLSSLNVGIASFITMSKWIFAGTSIFLLLLSIVFFLANRKEKNSDLNAFRRY